MKHLNILELCLISLVCNLIFTNGLPRYDIQLADGTKSIELVADMMGKLVQIFVIETQTKYTTFENRLYVIGRKCQASTEESGSPWRV